MTRASELEDADPLRTNTRRSTHPEEQDEGIGANDHVVEHEQEFGGELMPSNDSEARGDDEDTEQIEEFQSNSEVQDTSLLGSASGQRISNPFTSNPYELMISDGRCSFTRPVRTASYTRFRTYRALAKWLTEKRSAFLKFREWWNLGPENAGELDQGCSVVQADLVSILGLGDKKRASSFSRFLNGCELVWPDGVAPIRILFSREAKLAWVARAVAHSLPKSSEPHTEETLKRVYARITVQGEPLNKMALVRWEDVLEKYRDRMLHPLSNDQSNNSASTASACS